MISDAPDEVEDVDAGVGLSKQVADPVVDVVKAEVGVAPELHATRPVCDAAAEQEARLGHVGDVEGRDGDTYPRV